MFENKLNTDEQERGQVGIGTLIVFIALVLVAAIAAGVLINTAGFLQSQAEATGEESTSQVSDNIELVSATAEASADDEIQIVELRVSLAPGSDRLNVSDATIEWVGESDSATIPVEPDGTNNLDTYKTGAVDAVTAPSNAVVPSGESQELTDESDRTTIILVSGGANAVGGVDNGDALTNDLPMNGDDSADVTITVRSGGQTTTTLNAPSIIKADEGVDL
jgi:flagellin FlaB